MRGSVKAADYMYVVQSPFVRSSNGLPLIALHSLLLTLVSTPLRIVNGCCSCFPVSGGIYMSRSLTFG